MALNRRAGEEEEEGGRNELWRRRQFIQPPCFSLPFPCRQKTVKHGCQEIAYERRGRRGGEGGKRFSSLLIWEEALCLLSKRAFSPSLVYIRGRNSAMCEIERKGERIIAKYSYECPSSCICMV